MLVARISCAGACGASAYLAVASLITITEGWRLSAVQRGASEIEPRAWCPECTASGVTVARAHSRPITCG